MAASTGGRNRRKEGHNVRLSKSLSTILRHQAHKMGLLMKPDGYVYVDVLLTSSRCWLSREPYTEADILRVVADNDKQRFSVRRDEAGRLEIRANQGHSVEVAELELRPITDAGEFPDVVHGTSWQAWASIRSQGLKVMNRTHVHFAPGVLGAEGVISGMRRNCDVLIYLDMAAALTDGLEFFLSANRVVLCKGDASGTIAPKYFAQALDGKKRTAIQR